jgi:hypothetical protein
MSACNWSENGHLDGSHVLSQRDDGVPWSVIRDMATPPEAPEDLPDGHVTLREVGLDQEPVLSAPVTGQPHHP